MGLPLWKAVWSYLKKLKMDLRQRRDLARNGEYPVARKPSKDEVVRKNLG